MTEKQTGNVDEILIQTVDTTGESFPGTSIEAKYSGGSKHYMTDVNGFCRVPKTNEIEVTQINFSEKYQIKNEKTNELILELSSSVEPSIDRLYIFKNRQLFRLIDDDDDLFENGFKRLSRKESDMLFPKK